MQACIEHARALLESARAVQEAGHPNIAYHLATLTLEELGRRELIGLQTITDTRPVPPGWVQKHTQDHIKKLFWCFFGGSFFVERLTKDRLESLENFAERVHSKRLAGLYVDQDEDSLSIPADAIDAEEATRLIELASARFEMSNSERLREHIPQEELETQAWFLAATDDREKQRAMLSRTSLQKLAELKDAKAWVLWIKQEFDRAEAESRAAAEAEIQRSKALPDESTKDKWKLRIRLYSQSHVVRPKVLTEWNKRIDWIKLVAVPEKKDQLLVEFILGDNIPVEALWFFGWGVARQFVAALNLGTMGFWWWRMPQHINCYYESLEDLDKKQRMAIDRVPSLKIDWGANRVLGDEDLHRVGACFVTLPGPNNREQHKPYNFYIGGLTFLSLNDVHWQCENQSFGNFFHSIKAMMEESGEWQVGTPFTDALMAYLSVAFPKMDERDHFAKIFDAFDRNEPGTVTVTLKEVSLMKVFCDTYYLHRVMPAALKARKATETSASDETSPQHV